MRLRLLLRGLRHRAAASVALLLVSMLAMLAASIGPIYLAAADDSTLHSTLASAAPDQTGLTLAPATGATLGVASLLAAAAQAPRRSANPAWYGTPIVAADSGEGTGTTNPFKIDVVSRTGACQDLTIAVGRCPSALDEVMLSQPSARALTVGVGGLITVRNRFATLSLRVVGIYVAGSQSDPRWWGSNYFPYGSGFSPGPPPLDAAFATLPTALAAGGSLTAITVQVPLLSAAVSTGQMSELAALVSGYQTGLVGHRIEASTQLPSVFSAVTQAQSRLASIVLVSAVELFVLALVVLLAVAGRSAESREAEFALAALRGLRLRSTFAFALLEPVVLLCLAAPLGVTLAWAVVDIAAAHQLASVAVHIDAAALIALAAATVLVLAALAMAMRRLLRPRLAAGLSPRLVGAGRFALAADAIAVALAVAALVDLSSIGVTGAGSTNLLAGLAPGLLAVALAVVGRRLLIQLMAPAIRLTRSSSRVGTFLAVRHLRRRPATVRPLLVVTAATSLLTFALAGWLVGAANRDDQATFVLGADRVLTVRAPTGVSLETAVRRADPGGHQAMAVVRLESSSELLLAVDTSRFSAVSAWGSAVTSPSAAQVARQLAPPARSPLQLSGTGLRLDVDAGAGATAEGAGLDATVFNTSDRMLSTLSFGSLRAGAASYAAALPAGCAADCRLDSIGVVWPGSVLNSGDIETVDLNLTAIDSLAAGGGAVALSTAGLRTAGAWHGVSASATAAAGGLSCHFVLGASQLPPEVVPASIPATLSVVITDQLAADDGVISKGQDVQLGNIDGNTVTMRAAALVPALPGAGDDAVLVDLTAAGLAQMAPEADTTDEVWLSPTADAATLTALRAQNLTITGSAAAADQVEAAAHGVDGSSDTFLLIAAAIAGLLALGCCATLLFGDASARGAELAALMAAGVGRAALARSVAVENGAVLVAGVMLGSIAGIWAATLALPSLPLVAALSGGPPLNFSLPWGALAAVVGGAVACLVVVDVIAIGIALSGAGVAGRARANGR